jgi:plastocyanin
LIVRARHRGWAAGLLAGVAGLAVIGPVLLVGTASPAAAATTWDVAATNNTFKPNYLNIKPGDRVLWTNQDNTVHSVTSDQGNTTFDTDLGKRGATFERRFDTAGTYTYHCKYHSSMVGTIDVGVPATTTTTAPPPTTTTTVTTAPPTTTTTAPATTTTSEPTTTTTTAPRPAAGPAPVPAPPVSSSSAGAPPPPSPTTTSAPSSTTTTTVPPTTATSAPPAPAGGEAPAPPPAPATPPTSAGKADTGDKIPSAAGPPAGPGGDLDVGAIALVSALVAVGAFGAWTLIRVRPGRV